MLYIYNLFVSDNLSRYTRTSQGSHPFALNHSSLFSSFVYCSRHLFNFRFSSLHLNTTIQPCSFAHFANAVVVRMMRMRVERERERENVKKRKTYRRLCRRISSTRTCTIRPNVFAYSPYSIDYHEQHPLHLPSSIEFVFSKISTLSLSNSNLVCVFSEFEKERETFT